MSFARLKKHYVSDVEQFLSNLSDKLEDTPAQLKEKQKHKPIFMKRDKADYANAPNEIWGDF